jgi:hypothetical protein
VSLRILIALAAIALVGCWLQRDALGIGLVSDDYIHQGMFDGTYAGTGYVPFDLYSIFRADEAELRRHLEIGTAPWWSMMPWDPDYAGRDALLFSVFRPVSSALLSLDRWLFPLETPGAVRLWHYHSMLWFGAATFSAGLALLRLLRPSLALLAVLLFACDAGLVAPLAWLANRCVLVSATFGFLALWAHVGWRHAPGSSWRGRAWLAAEVTFLVLGVGAGEYGLAAAAYVLAYDLIAAPRAGGWTRRLVPSTPAGIVVSTYLLLHGFLGYGIHGQVYADPLSAPLAWLLEAAQRLPKLAACAFWSLPASSAIFAQNVLVHFRSGMTPGVDDLEARLIHFGLSLLLVGLAWTALRLPRATLDGAEWNRLKSLAVGSLLGLVPLTLAPAHSRLLPVAQLAACALIAAVVLSGVSVLRRRTHPITSFPARTSRRAWPLLAIALLAVHTGVDLFLGRLHLASVWIIEHVNRAAFVRGSFLSTDNDDLRRMPERDVVVLNGLSLLVTLHGRMVLDAHGWPAPRSWRTLAMSPFPMAVHRPSANTLEVSVIGGTWLKSPLNAYFRGRGQPLQAGGIRERPGLRAKILEDDDGDPTRVRFRFQSSVDDPRYLFLALSPDGLHRWTLPEIGGVGVVPVPHLPRLRRGETIVFPAPPGRPVQ